MNVFPTILALCLSPVGAAQQRERPRPEGWTESERTELMATCVVRGRVRIPDPEALERAVRRGGAYVQIEVVVRETLKGKARGRVSFLFFAAPPNHPHHYVPNADDMRTHDGCDRMVLLQQVGTRFFLADRFNGVAILDDEPAQVEQMKKTIARHEAMAEMVPDDDVPHVAEVERILDEIAANQDDEHLGFIRLQTLGPEAVPAIVRKLDDTRPIHASGIALAVNETDPKGPFRTVTARVFRDALFGVLQGLTGEFCAFDPLYADESQVGRAVRNWRIYAQYVISDTTQR